uniref:non-specific serine/threonine protein kinase n=1 Tax=Phallusia mammillata TaxID=59560 RepID=A0A6F9DMM8_9ASCI|nr:serine/threonine-protein kinase Nek6-like [Phallusia mammillata]
MENYKLLQRLGRGAQGSVYLVEHKEDKSMYVLKKVECNDEGEANKAFKEAMALQELRHRYVCGYKEFFVTWDREECAMFVCIVMNYYEMGDLAKVIKTKRLKQEGIDEMILKKWLGQMVEALVFVHNKKVIHRDLKPSNIFMTKNLSISIGDFGVATVMGDARTRTRTTVGSMNWMAPEVMERPYDERSDVWSLGCILLELATCSFMDPVQISSTLFEIKQNPQCLEDILAELAHHKYTAHLCQLIRTMLRRNFQQRPTAVELIAFPYVKECLLLDPNSKLVEKKTIHSAPQDSLPKEGDAQAIFAYMAKNQLNEQAQKQALQHLKKKMDDDKFCISLNEAMKMQLIQVLETHMDCAEIQLNGCKILLRLIENEGGVVDIFYIQNMIKPVLVAMRSHPTSEEFQHTACSLIMALSADENAAECIGQAGGVQDILSVMRQFDSQADICASCCGVLWSLSVNELNAKIVTEEKGLKDVCNAMEAHNSDPVLLEAACSAIWSLSLEDDNVDLLSEVAITLIIESLQKHPRHMKVVKSALMALASIITCGEECAYKVISPNNDVSGLQVIVDTFKLHKKEVDIAESFCTLLLELSEYDDIMDDLKAPSMKLEQLVQSIKTSFQSNEDIVATCVSILSKFGTKVALSPRRPTSARARPRSAAKNKT